MYIKQVNFTAYIKIFFSVFLVFSFQTAEAVAFWEVGAFDNTTVLILIISAVLILLIMPFGFYRVMLKGQITAGVHPNIFKWTLILIFIGIYFLLGYYLLAVNLSVLGVGYFAIIAGIYLFFVIIMLLTGKIANWVWFFLLFIILIIVSHFLLTSL